jgi:preprotein translocase subunit SecB
MDKSKQPGISFDNIMLVKESFWRDFVVPAKSKVELDVKHNWNGSEGKYVSELLTTLKLIADEKEVLKLESTFVGLFSIINGHENMNIEDYIKNNSPALMLPYIREHISCITQKAGIRPVLLPPINIVALIKTNTEN